MFTYQFNSVKSKDEYIDQLFFQQADKVDKTNFIENPSSFFWNQLGVNIDVAKIIHDANKDTDPTGNKAILCKGYLLFCGKFASYLSASKKKSVIYPADNKEADPELQALFNPSMFTETQRNMHRCRAVSLVKSTTNSDGSIEYRFIDPSLIPYFVTRMSYEFRKLNYDMWALSAKDEKDRERLTKDPLYSKSAILFKIHNEYSIFLKMPNNENRIINGLDEKIFNKVKFLEFGKAHMLRGYKTSQEIYQEIMKKRDMRPVSEAKKSTQIVSFTDSIVKALIPFKNLQKITKDYTFTFQRTSNKLTLTCEHYTHPSSTAETLLAALTELFKLAIKDIGIDEQQYVMALEKSTLTITASSTKQEENINTLDSIANLIEATGYPKYPNMTESYFQEKLYQVKSTLFATTLKEKSEDATAVITCRIQ